MRIKHLQLATALIFLLGITACKTPAKIDNSYAGFSFEVECLGSDLDGTQTLRSFGKGKNKAQAMETAKKNAVKAVLFDGIRFGSSDCSPQPIIGGANPLEKHQVYFNKFFADGGAYKEYTSMMDEKRTSRVKSADRSIENWGIVVRVDRAGLKQRMINDGIIVP